MGTPVTPPPSTGGNLVNLNSVTGSNSLLSNPAALPQPASSFSSANGVTYVGNSASGAATAQSVTTQPNVPQVKTQPSSPSIPGSAPTTSPVSNNKSSVTLQQILQSGGGLQNPLNSFYQVQPVFKLFMTQDIDPFSASSVIAGSSTTTKNSANTGTSTANSTTNSIATAIYSSIDQMQSVIIAQTGVTGYNITSVEIDSKIGPNSYSRMGDATSIVINIEEPMGIGLPEAMLAAAQTLGTKNYLKSYFYLDLHFVAYDQQGNPVTNPVSSIGLQNRWMWQLAIVDIDVNLNAGGGKYTINAIPMTDTAYYDEYYIIPETLHVNSGGTLGTFTNNLATALNASWLYRYGNTVTQYAFKWHSISETLNVSVPAGFNDPSTFSTNTTNPDFNDLSGVTFNVADGNSNFIFQHGVSISAFIEAVIKNTPNCQQLIKDFNTLGATPQNTPGFRKAIAWRIEADVKRTAFEEYSQQYYQIITYHIRPYYTQKPISDNKQYGQAIQSGVSYQALQDISKQGLLNKRYDYLYTGLNIDVINFDVHYNFKWNAIIARTYGALSTNSGIPSKAARMTGANLANTGVSSTQITPDLTQNQQALAQAQTNFNNAQAAVATAQNNVQSLQTQIQNSTDASQTQKLTQQLNTAQTNLTQAQANQTTAAQAQNSILTSSFESQPQVTQSSSVIYAESLISNTQTPPTNNAISPTQVSTAQKFQTVYDNKGQGVVEAAGTDASVFGAIMGQLYEPMAFFDIDLTIRGDPYWIGCTNLVRMYMMRNNIYSAPTNTPDVMVGDNCILMHFRAPIGYGNDFTPIFKDSVTFNGIYMINGVKSIFGGSDGFKQELHGKRYMLINLADAMANQGTPTNTNPATDQNSQPAPSSGTPSPGSGSPSASTANPNPGATVGASPNWYNSPQAAPYMNTINTAATQYNVPPQLLAWQIGQESGFNPNATNSYITSSGQPQGIAQFTTGPNGTANNVPGYGPLDPTDPNASIMAAAAYDQYLYQKNGTWQGAFTQYGTLSGNPSQSTWNGFNNALAASGLPPGS